MSDRPHIEELDFGSAPEPMEISWPDPPSPAAFHGLAGDLVGAVREHTEADGVAILGSVLGIFGCCYGHDRTFYPGAAWGSR